MHNNKGWRVWTLQAQPNPLAQALGTGLTAYTAYLGAQGSKGA